MIIENLKVLKGPNYWSVSRHNLIVIRLNLGELEEKPTNKITGFYEKLKALMPSLYHHRCGEDVPGGFFRRVNDGTWMGHVVEHIALELQVLAGMDVTFGKTRCTGKYGIYDVVFAYRVEEAGVTAGKAAVDICHSLIFSKSVDLESTITQLKSLKEKFSWGPSTGSIVEEALKREIPVLRLDDDCYIQFGYGKKLKRIEATITGGTGLIAVETADNKERTKKLLADAFIPVPGGCVIEEESELPQAVEQIRYPLVIKPFNGNQGNGTTTNIQNYSCARKAFLRARQISDKVIVENFISGKDFRALVINYKFVAAALRVPASVTGDGIHNVKQLIEIVNQNPIRGNGHSNLLTKIEIDDALLEVLERKNYSLETILSPGEKFYLKTTANLSTGGTSEDVTDAVHPDNIILFERVARTIGLDICGIDIMAPGLSSPIINNKGAIIEVNAAPGLRMHLQPTTGKSRNVAAPVMDMLFPGNSNGRIPVIAITGTNGKTTTTRLVANMVKQDGFTTGYTTTDGIYINDNLIYKGDCSGPASAQVILKDTAIEYAVLEVARGGILRSGLGFDKCNCAIITNVAEDHLGLDGIDTIDKLALVKSVVAETVFDDGYAVLNADDHLVYEMKDFLKCKVALFSLDDKNNRVDEHCKNGGTAALFSNGSIIIREGNNYTAIEDVKNIPVTYNGKAKFNVANVLGATLAAYTSRISIQSIRSTLRKFRNTTEQTPGRLNEFNFGEFTVMVDYAHNPHGLNAVGEFVKELSHSKKVGVITGIGDRRDQDIENLAEEAAKIFDEIIIRLDEDLRGRTALEISHLLLKGIRKIDPGKKINYFNTEIEAVDYSVSTASPDSLTMIFVENVTAVCNRLQQHLENYRQTQQDMKQAV